MRRLDLKSLIGRYTKSFSFVGLIVATLFFAASLTPSLLPRHFVVQGILSGLAIAVGYAVGNLFVWLWMYLEVPPIAVRIARFGKIAAIVAAAIVAVTFLWRATVWQNSIRTLMEMNPVETAYPWRVAAIAFAVGLLLVVVARGVGAFWRWINRWISRVIPRRISYVITTLVVTVLLLLAANHMVSTPALDFADRVFLELDKRIDDGMEQPTTPLFCGSAESLIEWEEIGRQGKNFIVNGPTEHDIADFWGGVGQQPLRVYAGLRTTDSPKQRAKLALDELIRVGGFDRSLLIVATPTGTGWLDPGAVDTVEYMHRGDTAIVSMQYSYLPSWITILIDPQRSRVARQLFQRGLQSLDDASPKSASEVVPARPEPRITRLRVEYGPLHRFRRSDSRGLWSGPPFPSTVWSRLTRDRARGHPVLVAEVS
ncbi:MAG: alpha/beta-hydrolase N-terminal domain-containing protein [Pirellulales bacterium]